MTAATAWLDKIHKSNRMDLTYAKWNYLRMKWLNRYFPFVFRHDFIFSCIICIENFFPSTVWVDWRAGRDFLFFQFFNCLIWTDFHNPNGISYQTQHFIFFCHQWIVSQFEYANEPIWCWYLWFVRHFNFSPWNSVYIWFKFNLPTILAIVSAFKRRKIFTNHKFWVNKK